MGQVTGVLVGHALVQLAERTLSGLRGQHLGHIAHPDGERPRTLPPLRIVGQQLPVLLEMCAASSRVHHDRVDLGALEGHDVLAREATRVVASPGVRVERAAADLRRGFDHLDTGAREQASRRGVHVAIGDPHDASQKERGA